MFENIALYPNFDAIFILPLGRFWLGNFKKARMKLERYKHCVKRKQKLDVGYDNKWQKGGGRGLKGGCLPVLYEERAVAMEVFGRAEEGQMSAELLTDTTVTTLDF